MFFLDSNTIIYFFKGLGNLPQRIFDTPPSQIGLPAVCIFELEVGIAKSTSPDKRRGQLRKLVSATAVIPFGGKEASWASRIRVSLEKKGTPIGPFDTLIAGTALANGATLVTHNLREFERVEGLQVEDWY